MAQHVPAGHLTTSDPHADPSNPSLPIENVVLETCQGRIVAQRYAQ